MRLPSVAVAPESVSSSVAGPPAAEGAADFESVRSRLFGIAYRMLGAADAEDVVQDVWIRWQAVDRPRVHDRVPFLVTVTTRVALDAVTSARARREISVDGGSPGRDVTSADPSIGAERSEALELAVQLLFERLSPVERAVYVLREAFGYPFRDIAHLLGLREANTRQLARRARTHLADGRHNPVDSAERSVLLDAFCDAARAGDMARLIDDEQEHVMPRSTLEIVRCPQRTAPAEVVDRFVLDSTEGSIEHAMVLCLLRHRFTVLVERLVRPPAAVPGRRSTGTASP